MLCLETKTIFPFTAATGDARTSTETLSVVVTPPGVACGPGQLVAMTVSEFDNATASPFRLTMAEGGSIAGAVIGIWAIAFGVRHIAKVLTSGDPGWDRL